MRIFPQAPKPASSGASARPCLGLKATEASSPSVSAMSSLSPTFSTQAKKPGISRGHPQKSSLQGGCGGLNDLASCGDPRSRLDGQVEVKLLYEELLIGIEFRVAAEDQHAPVRCGEVDIEHLDSSEFVEDGSRSEAACQRPQPRPQGDVQAIGQER